MKKIISLLSVLSLLLFICPINVMAYQPIDSQLLSRGQPNELIQIMLQEEKEDLIFDNCYYESSNVYNYDEKGNLINVTTIDENAIIPIGQIKTSTLSLRITTSKSGSNTKVTLNYDWLKLPLNRYQDPICIAWDSNIFSYKSGTFKKLDKIHKNN